MLLSREIANFTRGESDTLRKAMGKKLIDKLNHMYPKFIAGGKANGHDEKILEKIWNDWRAFASYAFNKSHAACYAWVAYQTGYLKANYPAQYMAGAMTRSQGNISEITKLMDESKAMGIRTLGPDINESRSKFSVNHNSDIRFGLAAIKGTGSIAVAAILEERDKNGSFKDIYDFIERINISVCNKKTLESLALAGAFDCFKIPREAFVTPYGERGETFLDVISRYGQQYQLEKSQATNSLFGGFDAVEITHPEPPADFDVWSDLERLNKERDLIGIYITGHPLDRFRVIIENLCNTSITDLEDLPSLLGREITLGGIVSAVKEGQTKRGAPFGRVKIEDFKGSGEIAIFGNAWAVWRGFLAEGNAVYIHGAVTPRRYKEEILDFNVTKVDLLAEVADSLIQSFTLDITISEIDERTIDDLLTVIGQASGSVSLYLNLISSGTNQKLQLLSRSQKIMLTKEFIAQLSNMPGIGYHIN